MEIFGDRSIKNQKSVYVLEDDIALSTVIDRVLRSIQKNILLDWSTRAEQAMLALINAHNKGIDTPYDLIIADVFLDGQMTGIDFYRQSRIIFPHIPVILISSTYVHHTSQMPIFLQKPFSISECKNLFKKQLNVA